MIKYLVVPLVRFRSFLDNLVDKPTSEAIIRDFEKRGAYVELRPGDRVARQSDVQDAIRETRKLARLDAQRIIAQLVDDMKPGASKR